MIGAVLVPGMAWGCRLALVLAVDVSGSVDPEEYRIQMHGLAEALRDGVVSEALVQARAQVALVQWTGTTRQVVSVPWRQITGFDAAEDLAADVDKAPREWRIYSTAIGDALQFILAEFSKVPECDRFVIDLSGDGFSNEGEEPLDVHPALRRARVTVNALAIEASETDLAEYFRENVITGEGAFVVTADGFFEYARKMRQKLRRETTIQMSVVDGPAPRREQD